MPEPNQKTPATVPEQPEAKPPLRKGMPVVVALVVIIALIGIANVSSLLSGNKKAAPAERNDHAPRHAECPAGKEFSDAATDAGAARCRGTATSAGTRRCDAAAPGGAGRARPGGAGTPPMTAAQRDAIYGNSPNAPQHTSNISQAQAEAKQKQLAKEKQRRTPSTAIRSLSTSRTRAQRQAAVPP